MSEAENLLKKVRKLESNRVCPNCGTSAPTGLGFGNVCVKFKTFVCDLCKTSHQAVSHRVKSVSMSSWTMSEVQELLHEKGGGNLMCTMTWLANAPAVGGSYAGGTRPKTGDKIDVFKKFVIDCYEYSMFKGDATASVSPAVTSSAKPAAPIAAPVPVHAVNLFDFDDNATNAVVPPPATVSAPPSLGASDNFADPFAIPHFPSPAAANTPPTAFDFNSAFGPSASTPTITPPPVSIATPPHDPFAAFNSAPVTPIASSPAPAMTTSRSACSFDDIFNSAPLQPSSYHTTAPAAAKPNPMMANNAGFAISGMNAMMSAPSPPPMGYQQRPPMPMMGGNAMGYRPQHMQSAPQNNAFDFIGASIKSELGHANNTASGRPPVPTMNSMMQQQGYAAQQPQQQYNNNNSFNNGGFPSNW